MTHGLLHVVFTPSGAKSLRTALEDAGRDDQVISSFDCLSFGPINPLELPLRSKWVEDELGWTGWNKSLPKQRRSGAGAFPWPPKGRLAVARSAMEYAGFLELLWRMHDARRAK